MLIRTIEFVYHTNKYILKRNILDNVKKIFIVIIETVVIFALFRITPQLQNTSYVNWGINAIVTTIEASLVTIIINGVVYRKNMKEVIESIRNVASRRREK